MAIDGRLLTVIRSINEIGMCTIVDLHRATGISRPALYRIVDSLCSFGYVERINGQSTVRLTSKILTLSEGYRPDHMIAEKVLPVLEELQERIRWPLAFATPDSDMMIIQESTCCENPFLFDRGRTGLRLPFLTTSIGWAYLAHCSKEVREATIGQLRKDDMTAKSNEDTLACARARISSAAEKGYAVRSGGEPVRTTSIAVPVMIYSTAVGALCTSFPTTAIAPKDACSGYVPELHKAASRIATALS